jgi:tripartite-type tricarboxylate transporter receptor subunit TctC
MRRHCHRLRAHFGHAAGRLGHPFITENVPGAGSNLALEDVAKAAPDGCTLFELSLANAITECLHRGANVEPEITPIGSIASAAFVIVVTPSFGEQTVPALIAARSRYRC